jgi:hypothetical protein
VSEKLASHSQGNLVVRWPEQARAWRIQAAGRPREEGSPPRRSPGRPPTVLVSHCGSSRSRSVNRPATTAVCRPAAENRRVDAPANRRHSSHRSPVAVSVGAEGQSRAVRRPGGVEVGVCITGDLGEPGAVEIDQVNVTEGRRPGVERNPLPVRRPGRVGRGWQIPGETSYAGTVGTPGLPASFRVGTLLACRRSRSRPSPASR